MARRSRYADVPTFAPDPLRRTGFRGLCPRPITPAAGALEHQVVSGERPDLLALNYFDDDRLWPRLLDANTDFLCGADLVLEEPREIPDDFGRTSMLGRTLLVPRREG